MEQSWYAVRVRSNFEPTTHRFLESTGYETFFPTYTERRQWSDRVRDIEVALFSGYVFCRFDIDQRLPILQAPGVVKIVGFGKEFLPVPDPEIEAVRTMVNSPVFAQPWSYLRTGEQVRVEKGPLAGLEGILIEVKNESRLVVSVSLLQRSVAAEVNTEWVRPLKLSLPSARVDPQRNYFRATA